MARQWHSRRSQERTKWSEWGWDGWGSWDGWSEADWGAEPTEGRKAWRKAGAAGPSEQDRALVQCVNRACAVTGCSGFGSTGNPENPKLEHFAQLASKGGQVDAWEDWEGSQQQYLFALSRYWPALKADPTGELRLWEDLGLHLHLDFITQEEEKQLLDYWAPGSDVYEQGTCEAKSGRRFFHYGAVLQRKTRDTTKSTLGTIPCELGALPELVCKMDLRARIRDKAKGLGDKALSLDQLYVNSYDEATCIDFHHDNVRSMGPVIAGLSLESGTELRLRAPDVDERYVVLKLPPRSLYLLSGISRYHLQHAIPPATRHRLSLTFRTLCRTDRQKWRRRWAEIPKEEAVNAHWPLLPPVRQDRENPMAALEPLLRGGLPAASNWGDTRLQQALQGRYSPPEVTKDLLQLYMRAATT
ncbi:unnamed protein product [Effrenium voratum]|nr:unnamed protein product [Effrenium voratum]